MSITFCILIESNSQKNFFAIGLYTNLAAVTSREKPEYPDLCFKKWPLQNWLMRAGGTRITTTSRTAIIVTIESLKSEAEPIASRKKINMCREKLTS